MNLEDALLAECTPTKKKACTRIYHEVVAEHTDGMTHIKPGMEIPFICTVHKRVLFNVEKADLDEKNVNEEAGANLPFPQDESSTPVASCETS